MAAAFGRDLIFNMDRGDTCGLELAHGVTHIHGVPVARISVAYKRNVDARCGAMSVLREKCEIDKAYIGTAEQRCGNAVARHVHGFAAGLCDQARAEGIIDPGRYDQRPLCEACTQTLARC